MPTDLQSLAPVIYYNHNIYRPQHQPKRKAARYTPPTRYPSHYATLRHNMERLNICLDHRTNLARPHKAVCPAGEICPGGQICPAGPICPAGQTGHVPIWSNPNIQVCDVTIIEGKNLLTDRSIHNAIKAEHIQSPATHATKMPKITQAKNYHCDKCGQSFTNKANKYRHEVAIHNMHGGPTILNCSQCTTTFKRMSDLIRHKAKYHVRASTSTDPYSQVASSLGDYTIPKKKKKRVTPSCTVSRHPDTKAPVMEEDPLKILHHRKLPTSLLVPRKDIENTRPEPTTTAVPTTLLSPTTFIRSPATPRIPLPISTASTPSTVDTNWAEDVFGPDDTPTKEDPREPAAAQRSTQMVLTPPAATSSPVGTRRDHLPVPAVTAQSPQRPDLDATLDYTNDDRNPPASPPGSPVVVHEQPARAPPHGIPIVEVAQNLGHIPRPQPQQATSMDIEFRCGRTNDRMITRGCPFTIFQVAEAFRINILQPNLEFELNALRNNLRPPAAQPPTMLIDGNIREHRTQDIMEPEHTADV